MRRKQTAKRAGFFTGLALAAFVLITGGAVVVFGLRLLL